MKYEPARNNYHIRSVYAVDALLRNLIDTDGTLPILDKKEEENRHQLSIFIEPCFYTSELTLDLDRSDISSLFY